MSLSYFTIVHIIVIVVILLLSVLFFILSMRAERKLFYSLVFTNFLVSTSLCVFLMLVLDKYTKKGVLENVSSQRVLRNESIVFRGSVRNVGSFTISRCTLSVKLINQALSGANLNSDSIFKPSGLDFFSWFSGASNKESKPNTVEYKFNVAKNLESQKSAEFTVSMPYPPYFTKGTNITKINCY